MKPLESETAATADTQRPESWRSRRVRKWLNTGKNREKLLKALMMAQREIRLRRLNEKRRAEKENNNNTTTTI